MNHSFPPAPPPPASLHHWLDKLFCTPGEVLHVPTKISSLSVNLQGVLSYGALFGVSSAWLGDLDGDGVDDIAVGAESYLAVGRWVYC